MSNYLALSVFALAFVGCSRGDGSPARQNASQGQKMVQLETDTFRFSMPSDWTIASLKPALITGPGGENVQLSSFAIHGSDNPDERERILQEVAENARKAMRAAAADPSLRATKELMDSRTKNDDLLIEMHSETTDGATLFSQFAIAGPKTVVLATIEAGSARSASIDVLRNAVENIEWRDQE
jgi:hypothetical protein